MVEHENEKNEEKRNILVLVDYENIALEAADEGMVVDFEGLAELCRSYGNIIVSMVFVPKHQLDDPWFDASWLQGFYAVAAPSQLPNRIKQYRTADAMMIDYGTRLCVLPGIDDIVIVSHDADFIPLANRARDAGKQVILVAGEKVSQALTKAVDFQVALPMKR